MATQANDPWAPKIETWKAMPYLQAQKAMVEHMHHFNDLSYGERGGIPGFSAMDFSIVQQCESVEEAVGLIFGV